MASTCGGQIISENEEVIIVKTRKEQYAEVVDSAAELAD